VRRLLFVAGLIGFRVFGLAAWGQAVLPQPAMAPMEAAAGLGQDLYVRSGSTGLVLVVVRGSEVFLRGYGETGIGSGQVPTGDSLVRLCSLSKIFATDLLVKLEAEKLVRLDTPLARFAPAHVVVPSRGGRAMTLGDLATHTAGLPREVRPVPAGGAHFTFPDYAQRWGWLPRQHLLAVPGTVALYSNVGFDLLGDALQAAARRPYARLIAERTTGPLGMRETGYDPTAEQCGRLLQGAHDEGACTSTEATAASSGLYSTGRDMAVWLKYLLGTGRPQIPAQAAGAQAVYVAPGTLLRVQGLDHAGEASGIGLGWVHTLTPGAGGANELVEKTGGGAGFLTYVALNQKEHIGIFVAATDGRVETHLNLFRAANDVLLTLAGLPNLPPAPVRVVRAVPRVRGRVTRGSSRKGKTSSRGGKVSGAKRRLKGGKR
jgi:D-alanyl-D-alanine-carboxypeptidase/D-alanyl-D-alanine-endopeptidase